MSTQKQQTAAIYDRWLYTLGGGEQVAFAYAETLRDMGYKTSVLTHKPIDRKKAEQKMGADLANIELKYVPEASSVELSEYSEQYSLFINTSYLDYFPNRSQTGILSVFFPGQIFLTPYEYFKRAFVIPSFRSFFIYPSRFEGFKFDEYHKGKIHKWLGKESSILFNQAVSRFSISLYFETITISVIDSITFDLEGVGQVYPLRRMQHTANTVVFEFVAKIDSNARFTIRLPELPYTDKIAVVGLTIPSLRYILYNEFKRIFPKWEMRLHGGPGVTRRADLESYQKIITISNFCQYWIKRYWGLKSDVLYPPVNTQKFLASPAKKNHIIHIGRFFVTGHCKKQLDMVKVFKRLHTHPEAKNWELHFIGSIQEGKKHLEYFQQTQFEAEGYPVHFHTNISFTELRNRLSEAKIYWHATGLDEHPEKSPILLEHFGITTVEAMASGCVPVVINAGGQKEIVNTECGRLWNTRAELINETIELIREPVLLNKLSKKAQERSAYFSRDQFKLRFEQLLATTPTHS